MERTTVYLSRSLKSRVARLARERETTEAEIIRRAIDDYTQGASRPKPTLPLVARLGDPGLADRVDEALAEGFGAD